MKHEKLIPEKLKIRVFIERTLVCARTGGLPVISPSRDAPQCRVVWNENVVFFEKMQGPPHLCEAYDRKVVSVSPSIKTLNMNMN